MGLDTRGCGKVSSGCEQDITCIIIAATCQVEAKNRCRATVLYPIIDSKTHGIQATLLLSRVHRVVWLKKTIRFFKMLLLPQRQRNIKPGLCIKILHFVWHYIVRMHIEKVRWICFSIKGEDSDFWESSNNRKNEQKIKQNREEKMQIL